MKDKFHIEENDLIKYQDNFSEDSLWDKLRKVAVKIGSEATYCVLVLFYVFKSENVSLENKALIIGALGYFILPTDLISDFLPILGFTDDIAALALAYKAISNSITPEVEAKAKAKLTDWFK